MKKQLITFFILFISFLGHSQLSSNDQVIYLDSLKRLGNVENYKYIRVTKEYMLNKRLYDVAIYYKSGKQEMRGTTSNKNSFILEGSCIYYYENGYKKKIANYTKNQLNGKQFEWYENGNIKSELEIIQDKKKKTETTRILQFWDENKVQKVIDGEGEYVEEDENGVVSKGLVKNYLKEGSWSGGSQEPTLNFIEYYSMGKLISGISTDSFQKQYNYTQIRINATPKKGMSDFYNYIRNSMKIPDQINGTLKGIVYLSFVIDTNGEIQDITPLNKDEFGVSNNAVKLISEYNEWLPSYFRGIPIKTGFTIPITLQ